MDKNPYRDNRRQDKCGKQTGKGTTFTVILPCERARQMKGKKAFEAAKR